SQLGLLPRVRARSGPAGSAALLQRAQRAAVGSGADGRSALWRAVPLRTPAGRYALNQQPERDELAFTQRARCALRRMSHGGGALPESRRSLRRYARQVLQRAPAGGTTGTARPDQDRRVLADASICSEGGVVNGRHFLVTSAAA